MLMNEVGYDEGQGGSMEEETEVSSKLMETRTGPNSDQIETEGEYFEGEGENDENK